MSNPATETNPVSLVSSPFRVIKKYEGPLDVDCELECVVFGWPTFEEYLATWLNRAEVKPQLADREILAVRHGEEERWYMVIQIPEWVQGSSYAVPTGDYQLRFLTLTDEDRRIIEAGRAMGQANVYDPDYEDDAERQRNDLECRINDLKTGGS